MARQRPDGGHPSRWCRPKLRASRAGRLVAACAALALLGPVVVLLAACGNGGEAPKPTATAQGDASASCQALAALKTFRYVVSWKLESPETTGATPPSQPTPASTVTRYFTGPFLFEYSVDAAFVAPDSVEALISSAAGLPFRMTTIGNQTWVQLAGTWREAPGQRVTYTPSEICQAILPILDLSQIQPDAQTANDVRTLHYAFPQIPAQDAVAKIFGAGTDMDLLIKTVDVEVWLSDKDGLPVRVELQGEGVYGDGRPLTLVVALDVRDMNNKDIRVQPPL